MSVPFLHIEPTNRCNLDCVMCTRRELKRFGCMSLEKLKHIVDQVPGLEAVKLQGMGEPMLNPEIVPMMRYLRANSIRAYTAMNGTVLPAEGVDELLRVVNRIEYSIDTLDPDEYRRIRGDGEIEIVLENLKLICRAREKNPDVMISINCVVIGESGERFEKLFLLAREMGIDRINFNIPQNWSTSGGNSSLLQYDIDALEAALGEMSVRHGVNAALHRPVEGCSECKWSRIGCYVTWDGYVTPCCQRPDPDEINFGNVFRTGFRRIYTSPRYTDFRETLKRGNAPPECQNCSVYVKKQVENGCALSLQP